MGVLFTVPLLPGIVVDGIGGDVVVVVDGRRSGAAASAEWSWQWRWWRWWWWWWWWRQCM